MFLIPTIVVKVRIDWNGGFPLDVLAIVDPKCTCLTIDVFCSAVHVWRWRRLGRGLITEHRICTAKYENVTSSKL